eukprot:gene7574-2740_t
MRTEFIFYRATSHLEELIADWCREEHLPTQWVHDRTLPHVVKEFRVSHSCCPVRPTGHPLMEKHTSNSAFTVEGIRTAEVDAGAFVAAAVTAGAVCTQGGWLWHGALTVGRVSLSPIATPIALTISQSVISHSATETTHTFPPTRTNTITSKTFAPTKTATYPPTKTHTISPEPKPDATPAPPVVDPAGTAAPGTPGDVTPATSPPGVAPITAAPGDTLAPGVT